MADQNDLNKLSALVYGLKARAERLKEFYSPSQPRVPKGSPQGGEFRGKGGGGAAAPAHGGGGVPDIFGGLKMNGDRSGHITGDKANHAAASAIEKKLTDAGFVKSKQRSKTKVDPRRPNQTKQTNVFFRGGTKGERADVTLITHKGNSPTQQNMLDVLYVPKRPSGPGFGSGYKPRG